jgi:rhomboid protease GluP
MLALLIAVGFAFQQYSPPEARRWFYSWALNTDDGLPAGQVWRLIFPMFLHGGWMHVLFNAHFLWNHSPRLEGLYGSRRFLLLYFVSGIGSSLLSWFGNCYLGEQPLAGWGASGALFGVATTYIGLYLRYRCVTKEEAKWWLTYLVAIGAVGVLAPEMNLDNWGHLGGALCGLFFALLAPRPTGR